MSAQPAAVRCQFWNRRVRSQTSLRVSSQSVHMQKVDLDLALNSFDTLLTEHMLARGNSYDETLTRGNLAALIARNDHATLPAHATSSCEWSISAGSATLSNHCSSHSGVVRRRLNTRLVRNLPLVAS